MKGFWVEIWRSPARAIVAGASFSAVIASILYGFNWHTFYDTRMNVAENRAELIANDVATLALATRAAPGNDHAFRKALEHYLAPRRQLITISRVDTIPEEEPLWRETNGISVDESRTLMASDFLLEAGAGKDGKRQLHVAVSVGVRPRLGVALARAWSFSMAAYLEDPQLWRAQALYNRSIPLYGYLLVIMLVGFGTIRAIYRDQQELIKLEREVLEAGAELDQFRDQHSEEILLFRRQMDHTRHQRDDAISHRDQLTREIVGIEREYRKLIDTSSTTQAEDPRLSEAASRKTQVERVLASYNAKVGYFENELIEIREELGAAEQLFQEVEVHREGLNTKLKNRNREIRKLHGLIQETQKKMRAMQSDQRSMGKASHSELREWKESQETIEELLGSWVWNTDHAKVNFSSHGQAGIVEQQFQKIDPAFVDRYFTHVNNAEYERGNRGLIRVVTNGSEDAETPSGKLIISLDDDAGRTLSMRFETRRGAPDPVYLVFVLALLLRVKCRDFDGFAIRTR